MFLMTLSGSFFVTALLHPQEFWCIVPGIIYLLCIPSMYLLLIIYSVANLNVVSWGTREVAVKKTKKQLEEEKKNVKKTAQKSRFLQWFGGSDNSNDHEDGGLTLSLGNVLKFSLFPQPANTKENDELAKITSSLKALNEKVDKLQGL